MVVIDEKDIEIIENALGYTLYDEQKRYLLFNDTSIIDFNKRQNGKTTAYIIKSILKPDEIIDFNHIHDITDWDPNIRSVNDYKQYSKNVFTRRFIEIYDKLKNAGMAVCELVKDI